MNADTYIRTKKQLNEGLRLGSILNSFTFQVSHLISKEKSLFTNFEAGRNLKDLILHFHFIDEQVEAQKLICLGVIQLINIRAELKAPDFQFGLFNVTSQECN